MERITTSASKLVLIAVFATACAGFLWGKLDPKDFMALATLVGGYYFASAKSRADDVNTPDATKGEEFTG